MDRHEKLVREALKEARGQFTRQRTHEKWTLPDGRSFTFASTTSDNARSWKNCWSQLRKFLDLNPQQRGLPGERRDKSPPRSRKKRGPFISPPVDSGPKGKTLADQLSSLRMKKKIEPPQVDLKAMIEKALEPYGTHRTRNTGRNTSVHSVCS